MPHHVAYVETPQGIYRETDGVMEGPFSREELEIEKGALIRGCQMLRCTDPVSVSFGFGYGTKADNRFER